MLRGFVVRRLFGVAALAALALLASGGARAVPVAGYCVAPAPQTTYPGLDLTDVVFTIGATNYSPTDCYGVVDTGPSNIANNLAYVNNLRWQDFVNGVKDDIGGGANVVTVDSIQYTLTTGIISGSGLNTVQNWTLSWSDTNGAALPNLPVIVDFALLWNGGNQDVFYLLEDVLLPLSPTSGSGTIDIVVTNPPGNNDIGTSHLDVFLTNAGTPPSSSGSTGGTPAAVPEPSSSALALLGMVLLGATLVVRNRAMQRG